MEKPKVLGISEYPTDADLESVRSSEETSVWFSLNDLIRNPDAVVSLTSLIQDKRISNDLLKILTLEKDSEELFQFLGEVENLIDGYREFERKLDPLTREKFIKDLFQYLDKFNIHIDKEALVDRLNHVSVNFVDYVRYFAQAIKSNVDMEEACILSGYYTQDGDSVTVNITTIDSAVESLNLEEDQKSEAREELTESTLRHEFVHALSYRNYWLTENEEDHEPQTDARRLGIRNISLSGEKIRLTWLNEAITERVNQETLGKQKFNLVSYQKEQEVLGVLCEYIDWDIFLSACFTRDGFLDLGRAVKEKTGLSLSEIDEVMNEDQRENFSNNRAIQLIRSSAEKVLDKPIPASTTLQ